jgi:hypothetical protein
MKTIRNLAFLGAALGLAVVALYAGKSSGPIPAIINFYGAQLRNPTGPFPGLHADNPNPPSAPTVDMNTPSEDYVDGTQNVAAFFFSGTRNAGMTMPADSRQPIGRSLYLDFSSPISILDPLTPPFLGSATNGLVGTGVSISQNMLVDDGNGNLICCAGSGNGLMFLKPGDPTRYAQLALFWTDPTRNLSWTLVWGTRALGSCLQTSVNTPGDIWTVNTYPAGTDPLSLHSGCRRPDGNFDVGQLSYAPTRGKGPSGIQGYYHLPFLLTIKQK